MEIRELTIENFEEVFSLWESSGGIGLDRMSDTKERIWIYFRRNPGLSFAAFEKGKVIGAVLCGHDGRHGYLYHLSVAEAHRHKGVGTALTEKVISKLRILGVRKCITFVFPNNAEGQNFWAGNGWAERTELKVLTKNITP